jgi:hypothetical protein
MFFPPIARSHASVRESPQFRDRESEFSDPIRWQWTSWESAWKTEIHRRIDEIKNGKIQGIPVEESLARARKIAGL